MFPDEAKPRSLLFFSLSASPLPINISETQLKWRYYTHLQLDLPLGMEYSSTPVSPEDQAVVFDDLGRYFVVSLVGVVSETGLWTIYLVLFCWALRLQMYVSHCRSRFCFYRLHFSPVSLSN